MEEAVAVAVVIITKIICVCGLIFIECIFAPLCGVVLQTIIGFFAASFAAILSNFSGVISDIIDYINGYKFSARMAAYFPISNGLFTVGIDTYSIMVCGFIVVILSSIYGSTPGVYGYGFAPAIGACFHNFKDFVNGRSCPLGAAIIVTTIGRYCNNFFGYCNGFCIYLIAAITAITVVKVVAVATSKISFNNDLIDGIYHSLTCGLTIVIINGFLNGFIAGELSPGPRQAQATAAEEINNGDTLITVITEINKSYFIENDLCGAELRQDIRNKYLNIVKMIWNDINKSIETLINNNNNINKNLSS